MGTINTVKQGESYPFVFDRGDESITGWICTIYLKKFPSDEAVLSRVIAPVDEEWSGFLTQAETKGLDVDHYMLIGKLTNSTTDEEEQKLNRFNVAKVWA